MNYWQYKDGTLIIGEDDWLVEKRSTSNYYELYELTERKKPIFVEAYISLDIAINAGQNLKDRIR